MLSGCLSGEKNQLLIPKFIPDEARQNPPINQKLSFLPAARINPSGWAHLISRMRPHQRDLVVAPPEQSPNGVQLPLQEQECKSLMTKYGQFEVEINVLPNQKYASNIEPARGARPTLMGVYHLLCCGCRRGGFLGLGSYGSNSCSGILTTAFLGLSSLAPSSVDPFSPHRTFKKNPSYLNSHSVKQCEFHLQSPHLHAFDAAHSSPTIVGCIHCGPLLPRHPIFIVRVLGATRSLYKPA